MLSAARPLEGRRDLEALLGELGRELSSDGTVAEVVLVGGSWLLWHEQRAATRDVDSAQRVNPAVAAAVRRVADRHGLAEDWLNDRAAMFWPADADLADCRVVYEAGGLTVKVPAPEVVFVMKLYRASPQDHEDMILLWRPAASRARVRRRKRSGGPTPIHPRTPTWRTTCRRSRQQPTPADPALLARGRIAVAHTRAESGPPPTRDGAREVASATA